MNEGGVYYLDFPIPKISEERLIALLEKIKPVVRMGSTDKSALHWVDVKKIRSLNYSGIDLTNKAGLKLTGPAIGLREIGGIRACFTAGSWFRPSVAESIAQIPEALLGRVVAFEICSSYVGRTAQGKHNAIVRLYAQDGDEPETRASVSWRDPDSWADLKLGIGCPFCQDAWMPENPYSFLVTELPYSYVRLPRNQYVRGWVIVALKRHAAELFELTPREQAGYWNDVARVAQAMSEINATAKINYCVYGNQCPHVHCHLLPRSFDDDPDQPVKMDEKEVLLSVAEYQEMLDALRDKLV